MGINLFKDDQELKHHDPVPNTVDMTVRTQSGLVLRNGDFIQMVKVGKAAQLEGPQEKTLTRREEIAKTLQDFKQNSKKGKMDLPTSGAYDRSLVHAEAEKLGLYTYTKQANFTRLFVTRCPPYNGSGNDGETLIKNHENFW